MQTAFIGFGSNLGDSMSLHETIKEEINNRHGLLLTRSSPLYQTRPVDVPDDQNDYINAVFELESPLDPETLLKELAALEECHGRVRGSMKNTSRTLDLDLLLVGNLVLESKRLTLPHPRIFQRAFVLFPLFDLSPELVIPGQGAVRQLLDGVRNQEIKRL